LEFALRVDDPYKQLGLSLAGGGRETRSRRGAELMAAGTRSAGNEELACRIDIADLGELTSCLGGLGTHTSAEYLIQQGTRSDTLPIVAMGDFHRRTSLDDQANMHRAFAIRKIAF